MLTCPPELLPVNWRFISLPISRLKGVSSTAEVSSTSSNPQPGVTTPAQGLHIQLVYLQDCLRPATQTATAVIGVHSISSQSETVSEAHLHARRPHRGLDRTAVYWRSWLEWANAHIPWRLALWRGVLVTDESWFSLYGADGSVYGFVWVSGLPTSPLWLERPMAAVGLCVGRCILWTTNTGAFLSTVFWMHTVSRSWGPLLCHSSTTITSGCSMVPHGPLLRGSVHNSWKLETSMFFNSCADFFVFLFVKENCRCSHQISSYSLNEEGYEMANREKFCILHFCCALHETLNPCSFHNNCGQILFCDQTGGMSSKQTWIRTFIMSRLDSSPISRSYAPVERHQRKPSGWRRRLLPHGGLQSCIFCTIHTSSSDWVIFKVVRNRSRCKCYFAVLLNRTFPSLDWLLMSAFCTGETLSSPNSNIKNGCNTLYNFRIVQLVLVLKLPQQLYRLQGDFMKSIRSNPMTDNRPLRISIKPFSILSLLQLFSLILTTDSNLPTLFLINNSWIYCSPVEHLAY